MDNNVKRMVREILTADVVFCVYKDKTTEELAGFRVGDIDVDLAKQNYRQAKSTMLVAVSDMPEEVMQIFKQMDEFSKLEARLKKGAKFLYVETEDTISYEIVVCKRGEYYQ